MESLSCKYSQNRIIPNASEHLFLADETSFGIKYSSVYVNTHKVFSFLNIMNLIPACIENDQDSRGLEIVPAALLILFENSLLIFHVMSALTNDLCEMTRN